MRYIDISVPLQESMCIFPENPLFKKEVCKSLKKGDKVNILHLHMGTHTGTHVDFPAHVFEKGARSEEVDLTYFRGVCKVFWIKNEERIGFSEIKDLDIEKGDRLLFKTKNSFLGTEKFREDYVYLDEEAAHFLVERKVRTVGIDYLAVEKFSALEPQTHKILLGNEIMIIEGLDLSQVKEGRYFLECLPLKILGADGAPVRAILRPFPKTI